tara:strand:- start:80 stop:529 length:450 start_codon:yes stop_codon:yes gene_type:complete
MSEQSLKEVAVNHDDIEKLETALDYIMYVARTGGHVFMPEDKKDFKPFLLSEIKRFLNEVIEDCIQENPEGAEIYKLVSSEVSVPKDSLWQYLTKDHLDHDNKLSDEEWETFVNEYGGHFAEGCTDLGDAVLSNFLDDISDDEPTEETQ